MQMNVLLDIMPLMCLPGVTTISVVTLVIAMKAGWEVESVAQVTNYIFANTMFFIRMI